MSDIHFYDVNVSWTQNRQGTISSPVLPQAIELATPLEFSEGKVSEVQKN